MHTATAGAELVGRAREIDLLDRLLAGARDRGTAVLVHGEAGIGKSALLQHACGAAVARGMQVLSTAGVESETSLPFAALHRLLRPLLGRLQTLPAPQRHAVEGAFGMTNAADGPELFLIGLAALTLIGDGAAEQPMLLAVDDVHWLDRPSAQVLGFVARRLESEPVVLVAAQRDGFSGALDGPALVQCRLERLPGPAAEELLALRAPRLGAVARDRLLTEAAGNPLALVELPLTVVGDEVSGLTLTDRLEHAFAARVSPLPDPTRALLLVAALNDGSALGETLAAASVFSGDVVTPDALTPAVEVQLVEPDATEVRFRHPLVRHAIRQGTSTAEQQRAHAALAQTLGDGDRRAGIGRPRVPDRTTVWPPNWRLPPRAPNAGAAWPRRRRHWNARPG